MPKIHIYHLLFCLLLLNGCIETSNLNDFEYKLVVEGWIKEGEVPFVILTQTKPLISNIDSTSIEDMIVRWAKVSVSDGEETEVLSGRIDKNYFPPFIYRGSRILGKAGKTYILKIEYSGQEWTAQTLIPASVPVTSLTPKLATNDTLYSIEATFNDPLNEKNYYKLFTKVTHKNTRFLSSLMGNFDDNLFNGQSMTVTVNQGISQRQFKNFESHFHIHDTVLVQFCTLPEFGFRYWTAYENELVNGQNPFFPANQNLPTNISNGGIGIWCGYGRETYRVVYPAQKKCIPSQDALFDKYKM